MPEIKAKNELPANLSFRPKPKTYEIVLRANAIGLSNSEFFDQLIVQYGPKLIAQMAQKRKAKLEEQIAIIEELTREEEEAEELEPVKPTRTAKKATRKRR